MDKKDIDMMKRHKTRIIAIDALVNPGERQYRHEFLLRYFIFAYFIIVVKD